jgi:hypothetical protein
LEEYVSGRYNIPPNTIKKLVIVKKNIKNEENGKYTNVKVVEYGLIGEPNIYKQYEDI